MTNSRHSITKVRFREKPTFAEEGAVLEMDTLQVSAPSRRGTQTLTRLGDFNVFVAQKKDRSQSNDELRGAASKLLFGSLAKGIVTDDARAQQLPVYYRTKDGRTDSDRPATLDRAYAKPGEEIVIRGGDRGIGIEIRSSEYKVRKKATPQRSGDQIEQGSQLSNLNIPKKADNMPKEGDKARTRTKSETLPKVDAAPPNPIPSPVPSPSVPYGVSRDYHLPSQEGNWQERIENHKNRHLAPPPLELPRGVNWAGIEKLVNARLKDGVLRAGQNLELFVGDINVQTSRGQSYSLITQHDMQRYAMFGMKSPEEVLVYAKAYILRQPEVK